MSYETDLVLIEGWQPPVVHVDGMVLDEADILLAAMLTDPIYCTELLWDDPINYEYSGCYRVRDYQYPLYRNSNNYQAYPCARSVGKTESIKARVFTHAFRRHGENMLITAPQLIHLLPLTDAIESRINSTRLTRKYLDTRNGKTGFTHRPFGIQFIDGTEVTGRIPGLKGTGVKGQHVPDLIIDEAQDYPAPGWIEVHETVMKDHVDQEGNPDFSYIFYGVHSGDRGGGFHDRIEKGGFSVHRITAIDRPGWGAAEKQAAAASYGGVTAADYRRNILGEAGSSTSAFFEASRLMACVDQGDGNDPMTSDFNAQEYRHIERTQNYLDELGIDIADDLDLPLDRRYKNLWAGMDLGLTSSPTVIVLFSQETIAGRDRMKLVRRYTFTNFTTPTIRAACYAIAQAYGARLRGFGMDITGLGFPIWQEMEADEIAPPHLMKVSRGYKFNAKVPVSVEATEVIEQQGRQMDRLGNAVTIERDPLTGLDRAVTYMPMIEASTRYLREWVDSRHLLLPFDKEVVADMMGETQGRVRAVARLSGAKKPNALHILDAMRAAAMVASGGDVEEQLHSPVVEDVLDIAW